MPVLQHTALLTVEPGRYTLKLAAIDASGRRGSVEHSLEVWQMAGVPFAVSDLMLGEAPTRRGQPLQPHVEAWLTTDQLGRLYGGLRQRSGIARQSRGPPRGGQGSLGRLARLGGGIGREARRCESAGAHRRDPCRETHAGAVSRPCHRHARRREGVGISPALPCHAGIDDRGTGRADSRDAEEDAVQSSGSADTRGARQVHGRLRAGTTLAGGDHRPCPQGRIHRCGAQGLRCQ